MQSQPASANSRSLEKPEEIDFFISRAGEDREFAQIISDILENSGYTTVLQQRDFGYSNFLNAIDEALRCSARVISLFSPYYFDSEFCRAEAQAAIGSDPLNRKQRLIPVRIADVALSGLFANLAYLDLVPVRDKADADLLEKVLLDAVKPGARQQSFGPAAGFWTAPATILNAGIRAVENFTGRSDYLEALRQSLWDGRDAVREARTVTITGASGIGKSELARKYAWDHRDSYAGVFWLEAEHRETVISELIDIGADRLHITGIRDLADGARSADENGTGGGRLRAARWTIETIEKANLAKPWLLIFDNVGRIEDVRDLLPRLDAHALLTSLKSGSNAIAVPFPMQAFSRQEAVELLLRRTNRAGDADAAKEAADLAFELGDLPLALDHAAAYCLDTNISFRSYRGLLREEMRALLQEFPEGAEYQRSVYATVLTSLGRAKMKQPIGVESLVEFLSYCAAEQIPRELYREVFAYEADGRKKFDYLTLNRAVKSLQDFSLVQNAPKTEDGDEALSLHRLVQKILRDQTDADGHSPAVVGRLLPVLCDKLIPDPDAGVRAGPPAVQFRKFFPHLLGMLPHLDAPDFRQTTQGDLLEQVATLVVLALEKRQELFSGSDGEAVYPENIPMLLGCFYEVDPLAQPLDFLLRVINEQPNRREVWQAFRDSCLAENNYVLRFALADALARAVADDDVRFDLAAVTELVEGRSMEVKHLNHFELGGYALKAIYAADPGKIDPTMLRKLAQHECYPGRSILGDLMLTLAYGKHDTRDYVEDANFWQPIWDFVAYDVNAIRAAGAYFSAGFEKTNTTSEPSVSYAKLETWRRNLLKRFEHFPEAADVVNKAFAAKMPVLSEAVKAEYAYLEQLDGWRRELRTAHAATPAMRDILDNYFEIGSLAQWADKVRPDFAELARLGQLAPVLRLLFGHPLWSVAETAASLVAGLMRETEAGSRERDVYAGLVRALFDAELPWRVRYGAMEAAFQIRLDEIPANESFFKGVNLFYNDRSSKLRGLCAENLLSIMLNASTARRQRLETEFRPQIEHWMKDEDCWVLEHVFRYFHTLHLRETGERRAPSVALAQHCQPSRLLSGMSNWWMVDRETFLRHIESAKRKLLAASAQDAQG